MNPTTQCAKAILETTPRAVHFIRTQARNLSDLTVPQFRALARLSHSPATNAELAERQGISAPTMSRMVEGLVKKGLIERIRNEGEDRRQVRLSLSKKGGNSFTNLIQKIELSIEDRLASLSEVEKVKLKEGLEILGRIFQ